MKFYLDEDLPPGIAVALRKRGIDCVSAHEEGPPGLTDEEQLQIAARGGRALVTRNRDDFVQLARRAIEAQRPHAGIVLCAPTFRGNEIAAIATALARLHHAYPEGVGPFDVLYVAPRR